MTTLNRAPPRIAAKLRTQPQGATNEALLHSRASCSVPLRADNNQRPSLRQLIARTKRSRKTVNQAFAATTASSATASATGRDVRNKAMAASACTAAVRLIAAAEASSSIVSGVAYLFDEVGNDRVVHAPGAKQQL